MRRRTRESNKQKDFKEESDDDLDLLARLKLMEIPNNDDEDNVNQQTKKRRKTVVHGVKSWRCDRCQEVFYDTKLWQRHKAQKDCSFEPLATKTVKPKNPYKLRFHTCKYCQETFKTLKLLKVHKKTHKPSEIEEPEDEEPSYKFDELQDLYICAVCSAEFQEESEAKEHIMTHKEVIICQVCKENFKSYFDLGMHSIVHDPECKVKCPLCSYVSANPNPYSFKAHVNYVHLKKFPYYCKECGKGFKHFKTYQEHQNTHVGKKPYICIVCQKGFTYQKYLHVHQVRNHQVRLRQHSNFICSNRFWF